MLATYNMYNMLAKCFRYNCSSKGLLTLQLNTIYKTYSIKAQQKGPVALQRRQKTILGNAKSHKLPFLCSALF